MGFEEALDLIEQQAGMDGFEEEFVGMEVLPVGLVDREGGEESDGGGMGSVAGCSDDLAAGLLALHAHVGDDHVVLASAELMECLAG